MTKLKSGTKYVVFDSRYRLAVPIEYLDKIIQDGLMLDFSWDGSSAEVIKSVYPIMRCKFIDGESIDHCIAITNLSGEDK